MSVFFPLSVLYSGLVCELCFAEITCQQCFYPGNTRLVLFLSLCVCVCVCVWVCMCVCMSDIAHGFILLTTEAFKTSLLLLVLLRLLVSVSFSWFFFVVSLYVSHPSLSLPHLFPSPLSLSLSVLWLCFLGLLVSVTVNTLAT